METRKVVLDGVRLSFDVRGRPENPKMVLLHALGERATSWSDIADRFAESFEVFALDLRGHGASDRPGVYSFDAMCNDVIKFLSELGLRSVVLVGHSMGGVVSYRIALQRPDLVGRLVIEDVPPPYERDHPVPEQPEDAASLPFDWAVVPAIISEVNAGDPQMWASLESITIPTLLIGGGEASHIPQDKLAEVADRVPMCDLVTIPAGHNVHAAEPERFGDTFAAWLTRNPIGQ